MRSWGVPAGETRPGEAAEAWTAAVTLRLDGAVVGRGVAAAADDRGRRETVKLAAREAIAEALKALPEERSALRARRLEETAARVRISVELGGEPAAFDAAALRALSGAVAGAGEFAIRPGLQGVGVRARGRVAVRPAGELLERGITSGSAIVGLLAGLSDDPGTALRPLPELAAEGHEFFAFNVIQIAQPTPREPPVFLHRGGTIVDRAAINAEGLREMAAGSLEHLEGRLWPGVERYGLRGAYDPVLGRYASATAAPFAQSLAAAAALRASHARGLPEGTADAAATLGRSLLRSLAVVEQGELTPWDDPLAATMALVGLAEIPEVEVSRQPELSVLRDRCLEAASEAFRDGEGFSPVVPDAAWGVVGMGLVAAARVDEANASRWLAWAESAVRAGFRGVGPGDLPSLMPYLAWASLDLAAASQVEPLGAVSLAELRELVHANQIGPLDVDVAGADLVGAVVYTRGERPLPDAESLRSLAFLPALIADERITPGTLRTGEAPEAVGRVTLGLRFVRQLAARRAECHMYADPSAAAWGVREALWKQRMPAEHTALALWMAADSLDAVFTLAARETRPELPDGGDEARPETPAGAGGGTP